ncbi:MAG: ABC transporter permease, partial [Candidatus Competibacteraceae bacterium]|nr:ABC transporter permease [Candidatus Competibacteraceae bacterium]
MSGIRQFFNRNGVVLASFMLIAVSVWIILMILLPQLFMLDFSFRFNLPPAQVGGPDDVYTLSNYEFFIFGSPNNPDPFNVIDVTVFLRTLLAAI